MITILCGGSRGDIQPYIALALEIKKLGKKVRIACTKDFRDLIEEYQIDYFEINADFKSLNVDMEMVRKAQKADNPLKMILTFQKMKKYGIFMTDLFYAACQGSELIVYHPGMAIGYFAAEQLGIPSVLATPFPLNKTLTRPSVILYGKVKATKFWNSLSYRLLQSMLWMTSKSNLAPFWKKKFGKLPNNFGSPIEYHNNSRHPAIVSCSNFVFSRPTDWNENIHQNGYWFLDNQTKYSPSVDLEKFLARGDKPIYIGFGSMFDVKDSERILDLITSALAKKGRRAIIRGMGTPANLPENIFALDDVPHSWLFLKLAAVCHHGGAGTTAEGFRNGIPSIIIPFALDQFAWGQRAFELGVGPKPIPFKRLNVDNFCKAIETAFDPQIIENAKLLAKNMANENGAENSAKVILSAMESQ